MKTEVMHQMRRKCGLPLRDRVIAYLPRYAPWASRARWLLHLRDHVPGAAAMSERALGFSARRSLPRWHARPYRPGSNGQAPGQDGRDVVLFADTFTTWFEPDNARAAVAVLEAAGYRVHAAQASERRPLCCGRTFLAAGLVEEARREASATLAALSRFVEAGVPVVGLEPSCLLTMRDEFSALLPGEETAALADRALLFEEFLWRERGAGRLSLPLRANGARRALVHGHCHQKAFGAMEAMTGCLGLVPELDVQVIESSCCGMAGAFGYEAEHHAMSLQMAELSLLPAVRAAHPDALIVADGTSCRHQIRDGTARQAVHAACVLAHALDVGSAAGRGRQSAAERNSARCLQLRPQARRGQLDIDVEHRHLGPPLHLDRHLVVVDLHVFLDDLHDVLLQLRQEIGPRAGAAALERQEHLQALLGRLRAARGRRAEQAEEPHPAAP